MQLLNIAIWKFWENKLHYLQVYYEFIIDQVKPYKRNKQLNKLLKHFSTT